MSTTKKPSTEGSKGNGRDSKGRFKKGWKGGSGNPHAKKVAQLKAALLKAIDPDTVKGVIDALIKQAQDGDVTAIKVFLDRVFGRPAAATEMDIGSFSIPPIKSAQDVPAAGKAILYQLAEGNITPQTATVLNGLVESVRQGYEVADFDRRLKEIEARDHEERNLSSAPKA